MAYSQEPFQGIHMQMLTIQREQGAERSYFQKLGDDHWDNVAKQELSYTALNGHRVLGCGGLSPIWIGRALGWVVLAEGLTYRDLLFVHRAALGLLWTWQHLPDFRRIEASIRETFKEGHHWATMLGFRPEGLMRQYDPQGQDYRLYARIAK